MAEFMPTAAQSAAINDRGGALLVSAAAGSGKTRVLTERLMKYITDPDSPEDIDRFLIITFSRAAAAELRGRISDELAARAAENPADKRLRRQSALVQRAQIGTIHSFCASLLRENCHLLGLAPDFAVADEDRARALMRQSLERVMDEAYVNPDPEFLELADTVGAGRDDRRLSELVLKLHAGMQCHARPAEWASAQIEAISREHSDAGETVWGRELLGSASREALYWADGMDALVSAMAQPGNEKMMKAYGGSVGATADGLRALAAASELGWDAARAALPIEFPRFSPLKDAADPALAERVKSRRAACQKAAKKLAADFAEPSEKLLGDLARTAPAMRALLRLVMRFDERFTAEKRRRSLVDFSDLEHLAAELLTNPDGGQSAAAREVSSRFTEIMVDEYQDVSSVQDLIIRSVSRDGKNVFMVGDVKQSIYRFRLADPTIFIDKYLSWPDAGSAADGQPRRVLLSDNFRSRPEIIDCVNAVFSLIMSRDLGELDYDADAALRAGLPGTGELPPPELIAVPMLSGDDDSERPDKVACEATCVAARIRSMVESGVTVTENGVPRPAGYGDFVILLRSANVTGGVYRRELARCGVPVQADQAGGFFRAPEITVMLALLDVIDNPRQDVPLISVLRSPLFGFTADDLSAVRVCDREGDFFTALTVSAEQNEKSRAFLETLERLRLFARDAELELLIREIYGELDCMASAAASDGGEAARANLSLLFELAHGFEASGWRGLHRFLIWARSMDERGQEPGTGAASAGGAVRIMSVHKSKGLEFPIVFWCDTARRFNTGDLRESVLVHPVLGLGPKLTDTERGIEYPTIARRAAAKRITRETLSEEMRLMYVAMTRARERLYITCVLRDPAGTVSSLSEVAARPVPPQALLTMDSPAKWLITAALADGERHLRLTQGGTDAARKAENSAARAPEAGGSPEYDELAASLGWKYPHGCAVSLPSKLTATELKSLSDEPDGEAGTVAPAQKRVFRPLLPAEGRRLTAAETGTATHAVMRYIDFADVSSPEAVRAAVGRMAAGGRLSAEEAAAVDARAVFGFFASGLGRRVLAADRVWRELPFTLLCPADMFFPEGNGEELLLQGVIDCCIAERGELTVIDYKTDRVTAETAPARAAEYAPQVRAYAYAMERMTGLPVKECALYFLRAQAAVAVGRESAQKP